MLIVRDWCALFVLDLVREGGRELYCQRVVPEKRCPVFAIDGRLSKLDVNDWAPMLTD